jgi:anti-sigma regulatory factor (Ser/Thr protein kinase)
MTLTARFDCELHRSLAATMDAVEAFFVEFRLHSQAMMERVNCFEAELLVREALTNAVLHGCRADPRKQVRCWLRLRGKRLLIAVADGGEGFDWRTARAKFANALDCSGRGLEILYRYASHVRFNDKGNLVTIIRNFDKGNCHDTGNKGR